MRYNSISHAAANQRKGVVLLIVMAMLTLFAALGISFVFYADAVAVASQTHRAAYVKEQADVDPELLSAYFLNQLVYGVDPTNNPYSSLLGHSLAETMWGYNPGALNYTPYNGPGRQKGYGFTVAGSTMDNFNMVNFTKFDSDGFQRRAGFYNSTTNAQYKYIEGTNVPWTAPDTHSMFLSMVAADGTVLLPSFVRPWNNVLANDALPAGRYLTLRPHQSWHPGFVPGALFGGDGTPGAGYPYLPDSESVTILGKSIRLDVRNNDFGIGYLAPTGAILNNDSIWMDLNFPIMTAPNGKRYRPLFAPLVVDLSNRLHLWAHGNDIGTANSHVSGPGWGVSEVNLGTVVKPPDLAKVFALRGPVPVTSLPFGPNGLQGAAPPSAPWYGRLDFDAKDNGSGGSVGPMTFPGTSSAGALFAFPNYPSGYENNAAESAGGVPLGRNVLTGIGRPLPVSEMEWLLRYGGTNTPATTSEIARLLTNTFNDPGRKNRNMLTLWSAHMDRIAAAPGISFDPYAVNPANPQYAMGTQFGAPTFAMPTPTISTPLSAVNYGSLPAAAPPNSELNATDWRSVLANRLRVNINRPLTSYPPTDATGLMTDITTYNQAVKDRQALAKRIYLALVTVTGAVDPNNTSTTALASTTARDKTTATYKAARWLAQLAVNMVDYIDEDDYMTPFQWDPLNNPSEWLFGTELPRLVINEFYGQYDNIDPVATTPNPTNCKLNIWLELHNPFQDSAGKPYPRDDGIANLVQNGDRTKPIYQLVVCGPEVASTPANPKKHLRDPDNNLGEPDWTSNGNVISIVNDWGDPGINQQVKPAKGAFQDATQTNNGFYVVGPAPMPNGFLRAPNPALPFTYLTPNGTTTIGTQTIPTGLSITRPHPLIQANLTVVLRRLANPHMLFNDNPLDTTKPYNPFVSTDYIQGFGTNDNRLNDENGPILVGPFSWSNFAARGRTQPYAANFTQSQPQQYPTGVDASTQTQPKHTFFRHNAKNLTPPYGSTLSFPFDWLTHLDRPLINPLELLYVSGYRPHELTQQFIANNTSGLKSQHIAPWITQDPTKEALIFRVLDLLMTPNHMAGTYRGGIHPGIVNINTVTEPEIFQGVADANNANFDLNAVNAVFTRIVQSRTQNSVAGASPLQPTGEGLPFKGFASITKDDTWLRLADLNNPLGDTMFDVGQTTDHPYKRKALLQKIYNNITATSNVFAVWWTVGYFEVVDESVRPAKLGAEIGRSENRQIRHRFFAIVDRSAMQLYSSTVTAPATATGGLPTSGTLGVVTTKTGAATPWNLAVSYVPSNAVTVGGVPYICIQPTTANAPNQDPSNTAFWQPALQPGMILEIGGANPEAVVVKTGSTGVSGSFLANFAFVHTDNPPIFLRGNPGPQGNYNPHRDGAVILHMSVIK